MKRIEKSIPFESVYFNERAQIDNLDQIFIDKAAHNFNHLEFQSLLCELEVWKGQTKGYFTLETGQKYCARCYDGQHRLRIAEKIGLDIVPASLFYELAIEEQDQLDQAIYNLQLKKSGKRKTSILNAEYSRNLKREIYYMFDELLKEIGLSARHTVRLAEYFNKNYGKNIRVWKEILNQYALATGKKEITLKNFKRLEKTFKPNFTFGRINELLKIS